MTARPRFPGFRPMPRPRSDDHAVSTVLGAILMFGLLLVTLTVIQVKFVPIWDKQRERDTGIETGSVVGQLKSDLDRIANNQTTVALSESISLTRAQGFSFFGSQLLPGSVTYTPSSSNAGLTMTTARPIALQQAGGSPLYSLNEDWTWDGSQVTGILGVAHLRMRVPNPDSLPSGTQTLDFTLTDGSNNCQGEVKVVFAGVTGGVTGANKMIEAQLYAAQNPAAATCSATPYRTRSQAIVPTVPAFLPAYFYFDPLTEGEFGAVLAAVPASAFPLKAQYAQGNTAGQVAFVYDQGTAYGTVRKGGLGLSYTSFNDFTPTGVLSVLVNNQRLPVQTYGFEYGAVFLTQTDGDAMVSPPSFSVGTTQSQAGIAWSFPALSGGSAAVTGARAATIVASPSGAGTALQATAQDITFTLTTNHPAAWAAFWDERMKLAGLSSAAAPSLAPCLDTTTSAAKYTISTTPVVGSTPGSATLNFFGPCSSPTDATKDVLVTLRKGTVGIALQPAG